MTDIPAIERSAAVLKRILVATDFSAAARAAVWRAGQLARAYDAQLFVVHAQPDWDLVAGSVPAGVEHYRAVTEHAERALIQETAYLEATFGLHARAEARKGRASQVLRQAITEFEPHLVVVGARGEHDFPMMAPFLGGTALKLLAYAGRPVLIVRKQGTVPYSTALAAVELSGAAARKLVEWADALLVEGDCHIVHAFDAPYAERMRKHGLGEAAIHSCSEGVRAAARGFIDEIVDDAGRKSLRLHAHLVRGEPVAAVLAEINQRHPDLVIVGKHEHPPRERLTSSLGSVAMRIAYHSPGDVLVVP